MSRSVFLVIVICFTCLYNSFIFSRNVTYRKHNLTSELVQSDVLKPHHVHECPPVQSCECSHSLANDSFLIPFFDTPVTTQATTGTTFIMKKTRQFIMPVNLQSIPPLQNNAYPISNKWVVVTTIFPPTNTIRGLCQLRDCSTVIAAESKSLTKEEKAIQDPDKQRKALEALEGNPYTDPEDYVFFPSYQNRQTMMEAWRKLFKKGIEESKLEKTTGKNLQLYSLRHTAIMFRLIYGDVDTLILAKNARTSQAVIEQHYGAHLTTAQARKRLHSFINPKER